MSTNEITRGIPADHDYRHGTSYGRVWGALESQVFRVLDEEGNNMADAKVRHLLDKSWLYVDDVDGFSVLDEDAVERLILDPTDAE